MQLPGDDGCDGHEPLRQVFRKGQRPVAGGTQGRVVGEDEQARLQILAQPLDDGLQVPAGGTPGGHRQDREAGLDERQRPVDEVGRGVGVGQHVGQLLELQGPLAGRRVVIAATEDHAAVQARLVGGDALGLALLGEHGGEGVRQEAQVVALTRARPGRP